MDQRSVDQRAVDQRSVDQRAVAQRAVAAEAMAAEVMAAKAMAEVMAVANSFRARAAVKWVAMVQRAMVVEATAEVMEAEATAWAAPYALLASKIRNLIKPVVARTILTLNHGGHSATVELRPKSYKISRGGDEIIKGHTGKLETKIDDVVTAILNNFADSDVEDDAGVEAVAEEAVATDGEEEIQSADDDMAEDLKEFYSTLLDHVLDDDEREIDIPLGTTPVFVHVRIDDGRFHLSYDGDDIFDGLCSRIKSKKLVATLMQAVKQLGLPNGSRTALRTETAPEIAGRMAHIAAQARDHAPIAALASKLREKIRHVDTNTSAHPDICGCWRGVHCACKSASIAWTCSKNATQSKAFVGPHAPFKTMKPRRLIRARVLHQAAKSAEVSLDLSLPTTLLR